MIPVAVGYSKDYAINVIGVSSIKDTSCTKWSENYMILAYVQEEFFNEAS